MISIIVCSVNKSLLLQLEESIRSTIGVEYEIIGINNAVAGDGICKVYNAGARQAKYQFLVFVHEDVVFETSNWGQLIMDHLSDPGTGLIGVAGGDTKGLVPSSWSSSFITNEINIIQHMNNNRDVFDHVTKTAGAPGVRRPAVGLDGVLLCTRMDVFKEFQFDELNLKGFHGYDIDYSLQVGSRYKVAVVFDLLIRHYSQGNPDRKWVESAIVISRKWSQALPVSVYSLNEDDLNLHHWMSMQVFLQHLFRLNYNYFTIIRYFLFYSFNRFFKFRRFLSMGKYLLLNMLGKQPALSASEA